MPAERPPSLPAAPAVLRRASGPEAVLFSRRAGGWLGRRPEGVRADRRGSSAARHQAVGLELVVSLPAHSAALLSGERRRLTTACVCSRGLAPPRAAPRLHSAWPRLLAAHASATLLFPCRRLVGSAASRSPRTVRSSRRLLCSVEEGAPQRRTRSSEGVRDIGSPMRLGGVGQRFTCSVESGVRVHRPGACVTATTALDYASRDCRHVELDPCHMTPGRVVRHHCRHDTSRCRTTPPSYDTSRCRTTPASYHTWGPSYDTTVVRHLEVSYDGGVV